MNTEITLYQAYSPRFFARLNQLLSSPLAIAALLGYLLVITMVIFYLGQPKSYRSELSMLLPGNGSSSKVVLNEVGQVSSSSPSPYGHSHNPRSNYKAILQSATLQAAVAEKLMMHGVAAVPKITLLEQTSIIGVRTQAGDPAQAQQLAWAYYEAFQDELDRLRADESLRRDEGIERVLDNYRERLSTTRRAIIDFQQRSLLISQVQVEHQVSILAKVRDELTFSQTEAQSQQQFINQLSRHLGVSEALAAHALTLQSDMEFAGYLSEMGSAASQLSQYQSRWGRNHPKVVAERQRYEVVLAHLRDRSTDIVGFNSAEILHGMNLNASVNLSNLFADLLNSGAKLQGLKAKIRDLKLADIRLEDQLRVYSRESAQLERLQREHQRAEAVYSSAAARLEAGQADIFASYPVVQLLAPPSLPSTQESPRELIAIVAGLLGFILISLAVLIVWQRHYLLSALLKKG